MNQMNKSISIPPSKLFIDEKTWLRVEENYLQPLLRMENDDWCDFLGKPFRQGVENL